MTHRYGFGTRGIHIGESPNPSTGAHGVPIYQNATYGFASDERVNVWRSGASHFLYARESNPTVRRLELKLANLEGAEAAVASDRSPCARPTAVRHHGRPIRRQRIDLVTLR